MSNEKCKTLKPGHKVLDFKQLMEPELHCSIEVINRAGQIADDTATLRSVNSGRLISTTEFEWEQSWTIDEFLEALAYDCGLTIHLYDKSKKQAIDDRLTLLQVKAGKTTFEPKKVVVKKEAPAKEKAAPVVEEASEADKDTIDPVDFYRLRTENTRLKILLDDANYQVKQLTKKLNASTGKQEQPPIGNPDGRNMVRIRKEDGNYNFFINEVLCGTASAESIFGSSVGFFVSGKQKVAYHNLKVQELVNGKGRNLIYDDFLNNAHNWQLGDWENNQRSIEEGAFIFECKHEDKAYRSEIDVRNMGLDIDFEIETETEQLHGDDDEFHYILWGSDRQNYYQFGLSPAGRIRFLKFEGGKWEKIIKSIPCKAIKKA